MKNKNRLFLNISFFVIIVLTLLYFTNEYLYYKKELTTLREMNGEGYYVVELFMVASPIVFVFFAIIEASIYYNLRYLIIDECKTTTKTVFNVIMLVFAACIIVTLFLKDDASITVFLMLFSLLLVLRILYIFIKKKY